MLNSAREKLKNKMNRGQAWVKRGSTARSAEKTSKSSPGQGQQTDKSTGDAGGKPDQRHNSQAAGQTAPPPLYDEAMKAQGGKPSDFPRTESNPRPGTDKPFRSRG